MRAGHRRAATEGSPKNPDENVTRLPVPRNYAPLKENPPSRPGGASLQEGDIVAVYEDGRLVDTGAVATFVGHAAVVATAGGRLIWAETHKLVLLARQRQQHLTL